MTIGAPRKQGLIVPSHEMFLGAPGYDPLDLQGYVPKHTTSPSPFLLRVQQEDWRGGRMDITEFIPPAPDVAMHFIAPVRILDGARCGLADPLAKTHFCATLTYDRAPSEPPQSGIYYDLPYTKGRHSYRLSNSELLVGRPEVYPSPEASIHPLTDITDEHTAQAHRVVENTDQLAETVGRFGFQGQSLEF